MNLFQKYGIKEVADIVFYSITKIDDEEFYTPVLYLDTLKVSNVEQKTNEVTERGGKTNRKVIGWNFNKDITIKLEDALFSPASMNFIWGGKFNTRLTLYTDTIARLNLANKYSNLNYSPKAKPSPELSDEAWELIYRHAEKTYCNSGRREDNEVLENNNAIYHTYYDDTYYVFNRDNMNHKHLFGVTSENNKDDFYVMENRYNLKKQYYLRTNHQLTGMGCFDISNYFPIGDNIEWAIFYWDARQSCKPNVFGEVEIKGEITYFFKNGQHSQIMQPVYLNFVLKRFVDKPIIEQCYFSKYNSSQNNTVDFAIISDRVIGTTSKKYQYLYPKVVDSLPQLYEDVSAVNRTEQKNLAMPQKVINSIVEEISRLSELQTLEHGITNKQVIDRMEKCIVTQDKFYIDINNQKDNYMKKLNNVEETYTIYYDYKTMQPLFHLKDENLFDYKPYNCHYIYYNDNKVDTGHPSGNPAGNALLIDRVDGEKLVKLFCRSRNLMKNEFDKHKLNSINDYLSGTLEKSIAPSDDLKILKQIAGKYSIDYTDTDDVASLRNKLSVLTNDQKLDLFEKNGGFPFEHWIGDENYITVWEYRVLLQTFVETLDCFDYIDLSKSTYSIFLKNLLKYLSTYHGHEVTLDDIKKMRIVWLPDKKFESLNINNFYQMAFHRTGSSDTKPIVAVPDGNKYKLTMSKDNANEINLNYKKDGENEVTLDYFSAQISNDFIKTIQEGNYYIGFGLAYWMIQYELYEPNRFWLKQGTPYYKWTRTVNKYEDFTLGRAITLDTNSFLGEYKIVGETYIRDQKTQKDQRYQITINNARLKLDNTLSLSADGDPTVFSMEAQVFNRDSYDMIELCQYDVEEDTSEGGYRIVPQRARYTFTPTNQEFKELNVSITNNEIY